MKKYYIDETATKVQKDIRKLKKKHPDKLSVYKEIKELLEVNPQYPSDLSKYKPKNGYMYKNVSHNGKPEYHIKFFAENRIKYTIVNETVEILEIELDDTDEVIGIVKLIELLGHDPVWKEIKYAKI